MNPYLVGTARIRKVDFQWIEQSKMFFLVLIFANHSVFSQATIPILHLSEYDTNLMSEVYGQSYFMTSLSAWTDQVSYYQGIIRAAWEFSADQAIHDYVATITTSDAYNDVNVYKDYVSRELFSQKEEALLTWEDSANFDLLQNRNQFVAKLNSNRVDISYLERLGMQNSIRPTDATTTADLLRQDIVASASNWQYRFNESFQTGLNDFSGSLEEIETKYNGFLLSLTATDTQFQDNLSVIDSYKSEVKNVMRGVVKQFSDMLLPECTTASPCAFRSGNYGGLNSAGLLLESLVSRLSQVLDDTQLAPTNILTTMSSEIQSFLSVQATHALGLRIDYENQIDTLQLKGAGYAQYGYLNGANLANDIENGIRSYNDVWLTQNIADWENVDGVGGRFSGVLDTVKQKYLQLIYNKDHSQLQNLLNADLGGKTATIVATNIYTDWADGRHRRFGLAFTAAYHLQGNWKKDGDDAFTYLANRGIIDKEQMGKVAYEIMYSVHDPFAASQAHYWQGNYSSLNGQLNQYTNNITPAIRNWETQVQSYNTFYENWKTQADVMKAEARANYETSIADINAKKTKWLLQMEDERHSALIKWNELYDEAGQVQTASEVSRLSNSIHGTYTSSVSNVNISTNLGTTSDNYAVYFENLSSRELKGVSGHSATNYTIMGAADQNKIDTRLQIDGKELADVFGKTTNGIYQFSQLISINGNNALIAKEEQEKLVNQMAWSVNWDKRMAAKIDTNGNLQLGQEIAGISSVDVKTMLEKLSKYSYKGEQATGVCILGANDYGSCTDTQKKLNDARKADFDAKFSVELQLLKDRGLEFQNGMIVRSLSKSEKNLLGISDPSDKKDPNAPLTEEEKIAAFSFGSCYQNPSQCTVELQQDFKVEYDLAGGVTLSRKINNGKVAGRNASGYTSGEQTESRYVSLTKVNPVTAPKGKDLFDVWGENDWSDVEKQASAVMKEFGTALNKDAKALAQTTAIIRNTESLNEAKFQKEKKAKEDQDSLIRDLAIAYLTGGAAGVRGAIKSKVEETINLNLATAWARASGADDDQIALLTNAIGFMKGKMTERKLKSEQTTKNLQNFGTGMVAGAMAFGNAISHVGSGFVALKSGNFVAAGTSFANGFKSIGTGLTTMGNAFTALTATSQGMIATGLYLGGGNTIVTGTAIGAYREVAGDAAADNVNRQITGTQTRINQIKAERESMLQSTVTSAAAKATGLPPEVIGNMLTDYKGKKEASAVRAAVNANPVAGVVSRIASATLGVYKTAVVAMGVPDRWFAQALSEGNAIAFNGITDKRLQQANLAYASQALGMQTPGTSYTSSTPSDKKGIVKELGQRMLVDQLSAGMSAEEKAVLNAAIRGQVSKIDQKKADQKAQTAAIRSTAITAVTMGSMAAAKGAQGGFAAFLKSYVSTNTQLAPKMFGALVGMTAQTIDGSRNGTQGMLAGFANGALGVATAGNQMVIGGFTNGALKGLNGTTLGLGVTYDKQAGWGGMIGIGSDRTNASIDFSQHGNTTVNGSAQTHIEGVQLTASSTTNGSTTIGFNYNVNNEGPRRGSNLSVNYDTDNGQLSGNLGYTNPDYGIGGTLNLDANGVSLSTQYNGNNVATVTANGFQYDEFNWAQNNINVAQDMTGDAERAANARVELIRRGGDPELVRNLTDDQATEIEGNLRVHDENTRLRESGLSDAAIARMSQNERYEALSLLENAPSPDATAGAAAGTGLLAAVGALVLGRRREGDAAISYAGIESESDQIYDLDINDYEQVADNTNRPVIKKSLSENLKGPIKESFGSIDLMISKVFNSNSENLLSRYKEALLPENLVRTKEGIEKYKLLKNLEDRQISDENFKNKLNLEEKLLRLQNIIKATVEYNPSDPQLIALRKDMADTKNELKILESKVAPLDREIQSARNDLDKNLAKVQTALRAEYKVQIQKMVSEGKLIGPLANVNDINVIDYNWKNNLSEIDKIVTSKDRANLKMSSENLLKTVNLTDGQRTGLERVNQTPQQFLESLPKYSGREFTKLSASERIDVMNSMINSGVVSQAKNSGMSTMVEAVFEAIRKEGKDNFQFKSMDGTDAKKGNFEFIENYLFGSAKDSRSLANDVTAELCKVYTNYVQGVANNLTNASFGDYLMAKLKSGDIGADSSKPPKPVLDQNGLTGQRSGIDTKIGLNGKKIGNDFSDLTINDDGEVMSGITRPLNQTEINQVLDSKKEGDVVQVYVDTDANKKAGPNHYHLIIKGSDGWYDMNHNNTKDKYNFFKKFDFKETKIYGMYE